MIKKLLCPFVFAALAFTAGAQTNPGFETWGSSLGEPEEPSGWITENLFCSPFLTLPNPNPNLTSVFKLQTPNNFAGTYSMKMKTVVMQYNPDSTTIPDTIGLAMQGSFQTSPSLKLFDRIPFTSRPSTIAFEYQYTPNGVDTGWCYVELTKWNNSLQRRDTIGSLAIPMTSMVNAWTYISGPIQYYPNHPNLMPDSMALGFSSSSAYFPKVNSELWLDGITFSGWSGINEVGNGSIHLVAYPNPTRDMITISTESEKAYTVVLYDAIGRTLGKFRMEDHKYIFNTSSWRAGNYYFSVLDKDGAVLGGNTFTVTK